MPLPFIIIMEGLIMKINWIWQMRHWDNSALLSTRCVSKGINYIAFSCEPQLDHYYAIDSEDILKCQKQKNGKGEVFIIPMMDMQDMGEVPEQFLKQKSKSQQEFLRWKSKKK